MVQLAQRALQGEFLIVTDDVFSAATCASAVQTFETDPFGSFTPDKFSTEFNDLGIGFASTPGGFDVFFDGDISAPVFDCQSALFPSSNLCSDFARNLTLPATLPTGTAVSGFSITMYPACGAPGATSLTVTVIAESSGMIQQISCEDLGSQDGFNILSSVGIKSVKFTGNVNNYLVESITLVSTVCPTESPSSMPSSMPSLKPTKKPSPKPTKKPTPKPVQQSRSKDEKEGSISYYL
jgi:hypothetical protein